MITIFRNKKMAFFVCLSVLAVSAAAMLTVGAADIPPREVAQILLARALPVQGGHVAGMKEMIVWEIRWPRVALAMLAGSSLAIAGACYQTMFRNSLADPFVLGVSSGAALGAAVAIALHWTAYVSLFAFAGGVAAMMVVYSFARPGAAFSGNQLLLAGVACSALCNALLSCIIALRSQEMSAILFWLLGSVSAAVDHLGVIAGMVAAGIVVVLLYARDLDVMTLGDENARYLGVDTAHVKIVLLLATTLMVSAVVAVCGVIGFIGLVVPHIVRRLAGPGHLLLLPLAGMAGATFLLWADGVTRLFAGVSQLPVGVVTALVGGPFFLYILACSQSGR